MRALRLAADALRALWIPPPTGLQTVAAEAREWIGQMRERYDAAHKPFEQKLLNDAIQLFRTFGPTQTGSVLLHGDARLDAFVTDGGRAVAIDPRPLVGEAAFDVASLVRDRPEELIVDLVAGRAALQGRFDQLTDLLDANRSRVKGWSFAVAVDVGLLAFESGDVDGGEMMISVARMCGDLTA